MKRINDILRDLMAGGWRDNLRRAKTLSQMEAAARRHIANAGFAEIVCTAASCENGELVLTVADSSARVRLRQIQNSLLQNLQKDFPAIKSLRFGIQS